MNASTILANIQTRLEAIEPIEMATPDDRFHGHVGGEPPLTIDRTFSVGSSLPTRNTDWLDPTEYVVTVAIAIAYMDGDGAMTRILDDAEQVSEVLNEMGSEMGITIDPIPEGMIHPGPVEGSLIASRMFRLRYKLGD